MNSASELLKLPIVSVIIPTFNRRELLRDAIRSVLSQTFHDFEVIIVNDGGEDVQQVVDEFNDKRLIHLCHSINSGLSAARNSGLQIAQGKYITFLDDDDIYYEDHLSTLVDYLEDNPDIKVVYSDAVYSTEEKQRIDYIEAGREVRFSIDFDSEKILVGNYIPVLCLMFNKECFKEVGHFDVNLKRLEDWDLWIRMSRYYEFMHIRKPTCEVRWRTDGSTMTSIGEEPMFFAYMIVIGKNKDIIGAETLSKIYQYTDVKLEEFYNKFQEKLLQNNYELIPFFGTDNIEYIIKCVETLQEQFNRRYQLLLLKILRFLYIIKIKNDSHPSDNVESPTISLLFTKIVEYDNRIQEQKNDLVTEYENRIQEQKNNLVTEYENRIQEQKKELSSNEKVILSLSGQISELNPEVLQYAQSNSWRLTRPLRRFMHFVKRINRK